MNGPIQPAWLILLGLVAGFLSGMFGIGGGLVIVPALVVLVGFDQKTAVGTSLFALLWPVGLLGVYEYYRRGEMKPMHGAAIALGLLFGTYLGARLMGIMNPAVAKRLYGIFLIVVGTYFLYTARSPAAPKPAIVDSSPTP